MTQEDQAPAQPAFQDQDPKAALQRMLIEIGPLLVFILVNWLTKKIEGLTFFGMETENANLLWGTFSFMVAMTASILISWIKIGHIARMLWVSFFLVMVFGALTLYFDDEYFIKIKPTIMNILISSVLLIGYLFDKIYLKTLLSLAIPPMLDEGWKKLTINAGIFYILLAILNEIFWRSFSTETWLNLKLLVGIPLTFVFWVLQVPVFNKYMIEDDAAE